MFCSAKCKHLNFRAPPGGEFFSILEKPKTPFYCEFGPEFRPVFVFSLPSIIKKLYTFMSQIGPKSEPVLRSGGNKVIYSTIPPFRWSRYNFRGLGLEANPLGFQYRVRNDNGKGPYSLSRVRSRAIIKKVWIFGFLGPRVRKRVRNCRKNTKDLEILLFKLLSYRKWAFSSI